MPYRAVISGTGKAVPSRTVTNHELTDLVNTSDEWIISRTGIRERRITTGETTAELAAGAALKALEASQIEAEQVELIVCATMTPDRYMPSTACTVQAMIGAKKAGAFDLSAACTGFVFALETAAQFIYSGMYRNVLVIGSDTISKILDWNDRSTCVLFGDGAGAAILSRSEGMNGLLGMTMKAEGQKGDLLVCDAVSLENPFIKEKKPIDGRIRMDGGGVYKYAVRAMTDTILEVLNQAGVTGEEIAYVVPHQANRRIISQAAHLLHMKEEKFFMNLEQYGNTSSASVAIALDELVRSGKLKQRDKVILAGFGGGMTAGAILMEW